MMVNPAQLLLALVYVLSVGCLGVGVYAFLNRGTSRTMNRIVFLGESFLLGQIVFVGMLLILSMVGLFRPAFLWSAVMLNFLCLLNAQVREDIAKVWQQCLKINVPTIAFIGIVVIFVFRNCYQLCDVDSLSTYLYTQKMWLASGTSLIGDPTFDIRFFNPQYDAIAYSLGISLFGQETLFPQMVTVFWRVICLLLVFGYTSYRFNGLYALAATLFVVLNDHFFYAGANQSVILNGALIAFMFAATYNFWEARVRNCGFRLLLALIFLSQIVGCKLYALYAVILIGLLGLWIQHNVFVKIREIIADKRFLTALCVAIGLVSLWFLKNYLVTKDPLFPFLSGKMHTFGWDPEHQALFLKICGGLAPAKILKYASFLFVWAGVSAAKYVFVAVLAFPLILLAVVMGKHNDYKNDLVELCFWLGVSVVVLIGLCMALWQDPRLYRFPIAVFAFAVIVVARFVGVYVVRIKKENLIAGLLIICSLQGYQIIKDAGSGQHNPTVKENIAVLTDRFHMEDIIKKHYPHVNVIKDALNQNPEKLAKAAWFLGDNNSAFLLPHRPVVSLIFSTTIPWEDYASQERVVKRLQSQGIEWVMAYDEQRKALDFISADDFSKIAMAFDRHPNKTYYDYGFPSELTQIR